mgnify:CR=1 FL=1
MTALPQRKRRAHMTFPERTTRLYMANVNRVSVGFAAGDDPLVGDDPTMDWSASSPGGATGAGDREAAAAGVFWVLWGKEQP